MRNFNPIHLLDLILADWASPRARRLVHGLIALVLGVLAVIVSVEGDWDRLLPILLAALYAAANKANTLETPLSPSGDDEVPFDGVSYEEAGGNDFDMDGTE